MRVIEVQRHGGPEVLALAERPAPTAGPGQILARVDAAGVNYADIYGRQGVGGYARPTPFVTGGEGAGPVIAVGEGVTEPAVGDLVAWSGPASYAEQVVLPASRASCCFSPSEPPEQVPITIPPHRLTIWVRSRPTPPAAACTTATSPSLTG